MADRYPDKIKAKLRTYVELDKKGIDYVTGVRKCFSCLTVKGFIQFDMNNKQCYRHCKQCRSRRRNENYNS